MRVVFLTHHYPRWPGDFSGAALAALARALVRRGHSLQVVAPGGEISGVTELDGVMVRRVPVAASLRRALADEDSSTAGRERGLGWSVLARLWRTLKPAARRAVAGGVDVVHAHWWIPAGLATPRGTPLVLTLQGADSALLTRSTIARSLARPLLGLHSRALADSVLNLLADADRLALARLVGEAWRARLSPDHVAQLCEGWYRHALAS